MQRFGHVARDQDFCIADFVAAKNFWRSNCTHLVTVARVVIERNFHNLRLVLPRRTLRVTAHVTSHRARYESLRTP